ncbi:MAG: FlgD immunoglobulin-like domain containing protein [Candidatus Edwardsbacteria bacterium]
MKSQMLLLLFLSILLITAGNSFGIGWCIPPQDSLHPLGNGWGEYQNYGGAPYLHPGIDVMGITVGRECRTVEDGWVKAWLTTAAQYHWRLAISDKDTSWADSSDAWLYAHIDPNRPHRNIGDWVTTGEIIGYVVPWPVSGFDHIHFARIRNAGKIWTSATWLFIENPLIFASPDEDTSKPVIEEALPGSKFAFCKNNTSDYLSPNNLSGDVDIVARIYDKFGQSIPTNPIWEMINPHKIEYEIHGPINLPKTLSFYFAHKLEWDNSAIVNTIFKNDATCSTYGDYDIRQYYYIVTNTDGDSIVEISDTSGTWRTKDFPNGTYWVLGWVYDEYGNVSVDSQQVIVNNPVGVEERALKDDEILTFSLLSNYPNPFNQSSVIKYQLSVESNISLKIYNSAGQLVKTLVQEPKTPGAYKVTWDGRDESGKRVAAGVYFYRLTARQTNGGQAGDFSATKKMILVW